MKIVSFPQSIIDKVLMGFKDLLESGQVAEGKYFKEHSRDYVKDMYSVPVTSGGTAIFSLLAYQKFEKNKTHAIIQSNTMRALYTVPKLLNYDVSVASSSYEDFLAMNPESLKSLIKDSPKKDSTVVIYSIIGGFLPHSFFEIQKICLQENIPLIVDCAHAHYLDDIVGLKNTDLAYSYYATKILPTGEGGLISTGNQEIYDWLRRFLIYDRFENKLEVGINLRPSELVSYFIYTLMTSKEAKKYYRDDRIAISDSYRKICIEKNIKFLDHQKAKDYNGYKFCILDDIQKVKEMNTLLTKFQETSGVFGTEVTGDAGKLYHWCPPTYSSLLESIK